MPLYFSKIKFSCSCIKHIILDFWKDLNYLTRAYMAVIGSLTAWLTLQCTEETLPIYLLHHIKDVWGCNSKYLGFIKKKKLKLNFVKTLKISTKPADWTYGTQTDIKRQLSCLNRQTQLSGLQKLSGLKQLSGTDRQTHYNTT